MAEEKKNVTNRQPRPANPKKTKQVAPPVVEEAVQPPVVLEEKQPEVAVLEEVVQPPVVLEEKQPEEVVPVEEKKDEDLPAEQVLVKEDVPVKEENQPEPVTDDVQPNKSVQNVATGEAFIEKINKKLLNSESKYAVYIKTDRGVKEFRRSSRTRAYNVAYLLNKKNGFSTKVTIVE